MRRFITYIYEYEQGNRGRNTGFIRTDLRENSCRMELQIRGFDRFKGKCPVYLTGYTCYRIIAHAGYGNLQLYL